MQKKRTRAAALALAALLTAGPAASASQALGTEIHHGAVHLAQGVDYTRQYLWSATYSDLRTEHYLEYSPNELVQPAVSYGNSVLSRGSLTSMAQALEGQGKRVLGGINGDYYVMATGAPLGMVVTDGVLRSSSSYHYALGFDADGRAFIGQPLLSITAAFHDQTIAVSGGLNKIRTENEGCVLYTSDFSDNTNHVASGVDVILTPAAEDPDSVEEGGPSYTSVPVIGGRMLCTVEQVLQSTGAIDIPQGKMVLSIHNKGSEQLIEQLSALQPGDAVEISITSADSRWESAVTATGGLYKMVTNGVVESGLETTQNPRSAVGVRPDGSTVFYTVDGRQSGYSVGASMEQVAQRLVELGCTEALCLDGGGSTTFGASLPGQGSFALLNRPSEGVQRSVTSALFLVADQQAAGPAQSLLLSPGDALLLQGTQVELSAAGVDALGQVAQLYDVNALEFDASGAGEIQGNVFTAGTQAGTYTVTAYADGLSGQAQFTVVLTPDSVTVKNEANGAAVSSINLEPGGSVDLTASAVYRNLPVVCQDESFTWAVTGDLGTITESGLFTSNGEGGTGAITVTAGGKTQTIPLSIANHIYTVEDFEGSFDEMADSTTAQIEPERTPAYVRYGSQSARVTYDASDVEYAAVGVPLRFQTGEKYLNLWIYGDGSGNTLTALTRTEDGHPQEMTLAQLNFTGWQQVTAPLPDGAVEALLLKIMPTGTAPAGTIWLDQVTSANQDVTDEVPPSVTVKISEDKVSAVLTDNIDAGFEKAQVTVTYDGLPLDFELAGNTVSATLPEGGGKAHRVTVTVTDQSGNIGRGSADLAAGEEREEPFQDTVGHWAKDFINYLYDQSISNGVEVGNALHFQPDKNITRGEFALMAARWLRLDLTAYSGVELPFVDSLSIPEWSLDGVKAMYALGIMQGSAGAEGTYAFAEKTITRAEAMTMLGRIQQKGYAVAKLVFADAASVPDWAVDYVQTLVAQGVVNGYADNTIAPNASITRCEIAKILYAIR